MVSFTVLAGEPKGAFTRWENGPLPGEDFFPIAVWLQQPRRAAEYHALGINCYLGLWQGPTAMQLAELKKAGMPVICSQNEVGLTDANRDIIIGWMHGDEPDNAQAIPGKEGWGPPIPPAAILADYEKMVARDPTRPVLLNLGCGVAWDGWYGRGVRTGHPEDYLEYVKGCDVASFDIYPLSHDKPRDEIYGRAEFVGLGTSRLSQWAGPDRPVWACIECTRISNAEYTPEPRLLRSLVWMALVNGARGLVYFVHQFQPELNDAALLADAEMNRAVAAVNAEVKQLAPVLNSPSLAGRVDVLPSDADVPVDVMVKQSEDTLYVFAVNMRKRAVKATFTLRKEDFTDGEVWGEDRKIRLSDGRFSDNFDGYGVHLYALPRKPRPSARGPAR